MVAASVIWNWKFVLDFEICDLEFIWSLMLGAFLDLVFWILEFT